VTNLTYAHGAHNVKAGATYSQTFLDENFQLGIVAPTLLDEMGCMVAEHPAPGTDCATLYPYDLTRGGGLYPFHGYTVVKEFAAYAQDAIKFGNWTGNVGLRFDLYNGLTAASRVEPRLALSYNVKRTGTSLRVSYARTLESPFNENLVISSEGCDYAVLSALLQCPPGTPTPVTPGRWQARRPAMGCCLRTHVGRPARFAQHGYNSHVGGLRMRTVNIAELKNRLSTYVKYAKAGETVIVRDRNTPVAQLVPMPVDDSLTEDERDLVARGLMRPRQRPWDPEKFFKLPRPKLKGNALLQALLDEREEGR
jgi:prevent-host-death family protein